jgi:D-arabinose 1-dehydrogenase-like Zn-dependent alcohol dehydrogenase
MQTMMDFAARHGVRPQTQKWPMTQKGVTDAMQTLKDGKMRYRGVVEVQK